jgi:hypothetical protein
MTSTSSPSGPTDREISLAKARVVLGIYDLEISLGRILAEPVLRQCKLRFFQNDRQEPGTYDLGANELIEHARHFLAVTDGETAGAAAVPSLRRVREGVENTHICEIQRRLATPIRDRWRLDKEKFGLDWNPIREIRWDVSEPDEAGAVG